MAPELQPASSRLSSGCQSRAVPSSEAVRTCWPAADKATKVTFRTMAPQDDALQVSLDIPDPGRGVVPSGNEPTTVGKNKLKSDSHPIFHF
jgi:hypothetical protein